MLVFSLEHGEYEQFKIPKIPIGAREKHLLKTGKTCRCGHPYLVRHKVSTLHGGDNSYKNLESICVNPNCES